MDKCTNCNGVPVSPISQEERDALISLPKDMPLNNSCYDCYLTGKESVRLRLNKERDAKL